MGTHWPQQHVSFHASFIHFITSLDECEGVEEKPCHPETEKEEPYSIFSSAGSPLCLLAACMVDTALWGCKVSLEHMSSGDTQHTCF